MILRKTLIGSAVLALVAVDLSAAATLVSEISEPPAKIIVERPADQVPEDYQRVNEEMAFIDARRDGFLTELLNDAGGGILKKVGALVPTKGELSLEEIEAYISENVKCDDLRPDQLISKYDRDGLRIVSGAKPSKQFTGHDGFVEMLRDLGEPFDGHKFKVKFKIVKIFVDSATQASTEVLYLAMGSGEQGYLQQNARWLVHWDVEEGMDHPVLTGIDVEQYEENSIDHMLYSECTESIFEGVSTYPEILRSMDGLWGRIDVGMGFSFYGDYAIALADVNNDGLDDLYVCQPGGIPNRLFLHNRDGSLTDISVSSGTNILNDSPSAMFVDLDNDGNQDLVLASLLYITTMKGDGKGRFTPVGIVEVDNTMSLSSNDIDGDGLLDIYVCRYSTSSRGSGSGEMVYDANDGKPNVMLRNEGNLTFRDVTTEVGLDHKNFRYSFSGVWEDFDNDGDLDLYVANDFGRNNLYQNTDGHFRDIASEANAEDMAAGMGSAWADYDLDGDMDLYNSNMFSSAGGRIVDKDKIASIAGEESISGLERFAKGNTLLTNNGDGTFSDVSFGAGITMGRWSWGGEWVDFNNDGFEDLMVPNGFVTNDNTSDL